MKHTGCLFFLDISLAGGDGGPAVGAAGPGGHLLEELRPHRPELLRQDGEFSRLTIISCPSVVLLRIFLFFKTINDMIPYYGAL